MNSNIDNTSNTPLSLSLSLPNTTETEHEALGAAAPGTAGAPTATPYVPVATGTTLEALMSEFEQGIQTLVQLGATLPPDEPLLPPGENIDINAWLQNGGLVDVIRARMDTAIAETDAQLAASHLVIQFAKDMFDKGMEKVKSMRSEADLTYQKGMLEAKKYFIQAAMALVSGVMTIGLAVNTSRSYQRASYEANNPGQTAPHLGEKQFNAMKTSVKNTFSSSGPRMEASPPLPARLPGAPPPMPGSPVPVLPNQAVAGPAAAPAAAAPGAAPIAGPGGRPLIVERGGANAPGEEVGLNVKPQNKVAISQEVSQRLNQTDMMLSQLNRSFNEALSGILMGLNQVDITEAEVAIKQAQADQAAIDTYIQMLNTVLEVMRKFADSAGNRVDQNYNFKDFLQALGIAFQRP